MTASLLPLRGRRWPERPDEGLAALAANIWVRFPIRDVSLVEFGAIGAQWIAFIPLGGLLIHALAIASRK